MIESSVLRVRDLPELTALFSCVEASEDAMCHLTTSELEEKILLHGGEPRAILAIDPQGWLVARSDGRLVGFAHCTVGRWPQDDPESLNGVLRSMMLAPDAPKAASLMLLRAADAYFRTKKDLDRIIAFHPHSGYPLRHQGRSVVFSDQLPMMEALGASGYRLVQRWLLFERQFSNPIPEHLPQIPGLKLRLDEIYPGNWVLAVERNAVLVAQARFAILSSPSSCPGPAAATLYQLDVSPDIQQRGVGRWLLERGANHLLAQSVKSLLIDAPHEDALLHALLHRLQFHEQPRRGYSYEKPHV